MDNFIPQSGTLYAAVGSTIVLLVGGMYKAFRMIKGDLRDDRNVHSIEKWEEEKTNRIKDIEDRLEKALERNEKVAGERNTALQMNGTLQGDIKALTYRLEDSNIQKDKEIVRLKEEIYKLNTHYENFSRSSEYKRKNENDSSEPVNKPTEINNG